MDNLQNEIFKIIKYNPNYKISNLGRVISIGRYYKNQFGNSNVKTKDRILKQYKTTNGYMQVDLCLDSKYIKIGVHRLVAIAFIENPENKPEVNHIDGNRKNNCLTNLEWCTHGKNIQHSYKLENRSALGENNAKCKTNEKIVNEICIYLENGLKPSFIRDLGYDYNLIRAIKARKNWNHISNNYNF